MALDISGLVLHKILANPEEGLEAWSKLKLSFFGTEYTSIYSAIAKYYARKGLLPSFTDLDIHIRDPLLKNNIKALSRLNCPEDVSLDLLVTAIVDEFTQSETLKKLTNFIENITLLDTEEIKQEIANILLHLEEKTHTSEKVCLMSDIHVIEDDEIKQYQVPLGINNKFDAEVRAATSELIMIGGKRGSGKSIVASNIFCNQYEQGNIGLYFSIEMNKREIFNRTLSILSGVNHDRIRNGECTQSDLMKIAHIRANMFKESEPILERYKEDKDFKYFEHSLIKECRLKEDNQLIIVDNQRLTLADIDMNTQKFKSQFGDKLKVVIIDYVNQIEIEDIYSWKQQITLSKQLKNFARKYEVVMLTPYQIDKEGEARFAKGILDAADLSMNLDANSDHICFTSTKVRGTKPFKIRSGITWDSLRLHPEEYDVPEDKEEKVTLTKKTKPEASEEDVPW